MRLIFTAALCLMGATSLNAQNVSKSPSNPVNPQANPDNIYDIKRQFQYEVLHNTADKENDHDNEMTRFNRWFRDMEPRCYPTGDMPRPDMLLRAMQPVTKSGGKSARKTTDAAWQPVGPVNVPSNHDGIGRVNCIIIDPKDTGTLYIGTACGGVFISHDGGTTWTSNTDNFPSLSIADIAVNPIHTDTIYAATGDGYGYENGGYNIFWGGLYSAGVMKSGDGGKTWNPTGLSYLQTHRNIIQKLLIHPTNPNILLAATRTGMLRTTDAGATWDTVDAGHIYSMVLHATNPNTVYAINNFDLKVSYNAGLTWAMLNPGINPSLDRGSLAVSAAAPNNIWFLDSKEDLHLSRNNGASFLPLVSPDAVASFYGYYDRVLAVAPTDSSFILAYGMIMAKSANGGGVWTKADPGNDVHVDNHAVAINPMRSATIYTGNDGGISVSYDKGVHWKNLSNGLMISQIYKISTSQQHPYIMLCGLQDNGTFSYNGTEWLHVTGGDGMACAIHPTFDQIQVSSSQYGYFHISNDQGISFTHMDITSEKGAWVSPVEFDPNSEQTIYFGYEHVFATKDGGSSFSQISSTFSFPDGARAMAIGHSDSKVLYVSDYASIYRTTDAGATWKNVTGSLPTGIVAITDIAVDYNDPMKVYVTTSGYNGLYKVFVSNTGGSPWTNISATLPNLPVNCIVTDSSTPGALFVGTDMGVYYTDASQTGWTLYNTGLPNVIVNDLEINYYNYKVRAATYGRGVWECRLKKDEPPHKTGIAQVNAAIPGISVFPNPAVNNWKIVFQQKPANYSVKLMDVSGRIIQSQENTDVIDASKLASGVYNIDVIVDNKHSTIKAVKK